MPKKAQKRAIWGVLGPPKFPPSEMQNRQDLRTGPKIGDFFWA